jgi:hypothetical protein
MGRAFTDREVTAREKRRDFGMNMVLMDAGSECFLAR